MNTKEFKVGVGSEDKENIWIVDYFSERTEKSLRSVFIEEIHYTDLLRMGIVWLLSSYTITSLI